MASVNDYYAIRSIPVTSDAWTPVTTPIACNTWSLRPLADVYIRTDSSDANTEDTILAGLQETAMPVRSSIAGPRYPNSTTICFLKAVAGSTTVKAKFLS